MNKQRATLKILLLQIRSDKETMIEEFYEFVQYSALHEEQFTAINALQQHDFDPTIIDNYDALFIGGSSDVSISAQEENQFITSSNQLLQRCYDNAIPVLASCFGFQMAAEYFGGKVCLNKENKELGIYPISLTNEAKIDILMQDLPDPFWAVVGHKECAIRLPKDAVLLAYSKECPIHAFKFINKPFYGFQFHPEMDRKDLIARIKRYQDRYLEPNENLNEVIEKSRHHSTLQANKLVSHFIDRIVLQGSS